MCPSICQLGIRDWIYTIAETLPVAMSPSVHQLGIRAGYTIVETLPVAMSPSVHENLDIYYSNLASTSEFHPYVSRE